MTKDPFCVTIHMVTSFDGFIAKSDNSISWFESSDFFEKGVEITEQDTKQFLKTIDCYVMGSATYGQALELSGSYGWAYGDVPVIVLSRRNLTINRPNIEIFSGDLNHLVHDVLKPKYRNVWVAGGASLVNDFIRLKLANEIRVTIIPVILGNGKLFLDSIGLEQALHLKDVTAYKNGMVELWYEIIK